MDNMSKKEYVMSILKSMGYTPKLDKDGDIELMYQMKHMYVLVNDEDEDNYVIVILPRFADVVEGEESLSLAVCNKMTREFKLLKTYVDQSFKSVSAACEFFYANDESLEYNFKMTFRMMSIIRSQYYKYKKELMD